MYGKNLQNGRIQKEEKINNKEDKKTEKDIKETTLMEQQQKEENVIYGEIEKKKGRKGETRYT